MRKVIAVGLAAAMLFLGACDEEPEPEDEITGDNAVSEDVDPARGFGTFDANGDSYLDSDELAEWADDEGTFNDWDADTDSELDPDEITANAFEIWDTDANDSITEEEWENSAQLWYPNETDVIVFNDVDEDGDSEVDVDEFAERFDYSVIGETWTRDTFDEDTFENAYFELFDMDNDGRVSETEWNDGVAMLGTAADA